MNTIEEQLVNTVQSEDIVDLREWAAVNNLDYNRVVGAMKSLEAHRVVDSTVFSRPDIHKKSFKVSRREPQRYSMVAGSDNTIS